VLIFEALGFGGIVGVVVDCREMSEGGGKEGYKRVAESLTTRSIAMICPAVLLIEAPDVAGHG
jgi:hypothetical protein